VLKQTNKHINATENPTNQTIVSVCNNSFSCIAQTKMSANGQVTEATK